MATLGPRPSNNTGSGGEQRLTGRKGADEPLVTSETNASDRHRPSMNPQTTPETRFGVRSGRADCAVTRIPPSGRGTMVSVPSLLFWPDRLSLPMPRLTVRESSRQSSRRSAAVSASRTGTSTHSSSASFSRSRRPSGVSARLLIRRSVGCGLALDEAALLELVGDRRDVRGVDPQTVGQRAHRHRLVEGVERPVVLEAQGVRREALLGVVPDPAHDQPHQVDEGGRLARGRRVAHERSLPGFRVDSVVRSHNSRHLQSLTSPAYAAGDDDAGRDARQE